MSKIAGKGQLKFMVAGLGWATAELLMTRSVINAVVDTSKRAVIIIRLKKLSRISILCISVFCLRFLTDCTGWTFYAL